MGLFVDQCLVAMRNQTFGDQLCVYIGKKASPNILEPMCTHQAQYQVVFSVLGAPVVNYSEAFTAEDFHRRMEACPLGTGAVEVFANSTVWVDCLPDIKR